ncbi:ABC transporter permease [Paenibacillus sp. SYP-B3998]|uniref:ABC transporter permease n=1 Tax=Paenibacillus sp. SYP-B3998 TaxID=2678564 RepID=A0A6G4A0H6_9BACL|nr:ABC transporter permease [Paenibacillus sp. SYP-B3998]
MINLIRNENMKIFKRRRTWIMVALLVVYILIQMANLKSATKTSLDSDWRALVQSENTKLEWDASKSDALPIEKRMAAEKIMLNEYYLEHNIQPQINAWTYTVSQTRNIIVGISFLVVIVAGDIVAAEFTSGTIKFLLTRSASRTTIYLSKYFAAIGFGLFMVLVGIASSLFFGGMLFGFSGIGDPYYFVQSQAIAKTGVLQALLGGFALNIPYALLVLTFAFMISAAFRSTTFSIVFSLVAAVAGFVISIASNGFAWTKYFVFSHTDLTPYLWGTPSIEGMTLGFSILMLLFHLAVMHFISYPIFVKRDVV